MSALDRIIDIVDGGDFSELANNASVELTQLRDRLDKKQDGISDMRAAVESEYSAELAALRAENAALRETVEQARVLIDQSCSDAVAIVNMSDDHVREMAEHLANQLGAWLSAHPAPAQPRDGDEATEE